MEKIYFISDDLDVRERNDLFLVVNPEPPGWAIIDNDLNEIVKSIPKGINFTMNQLYEKVNRLYEIDRSNFFDIIKSLIDSFIISESNQTFPVTDGMRELSIGGIYFELTSRCNLRCKHCYVNAGECNTEELSKEKILETIYELDPPAEIGFSGGEPLLRSDCMKIIEEVASKGYKCSLLTNGLLITEDIAKKLSELDVTVQVSLDGANPFTHDSIRGRGSFDSAVKAIKTLKRYNCKVRTSLVPTKLNYKYFNDFVELCKELYVDSIHVCTYTSQGRGKNNRDELELDQYQLIELQENIENQKRNIDILGNLPETLDIERIGHKWDCCPMVGSIHISHTGDIYLCEIAAEPEFVLGNIKDMALEKILGSEKLEWFKNHSHNRINQIEDCRKCVWRNLCGGGCMVLSLTQVGEINSPDNLCKHRKYWFEELIWRKMKDVSYQNVQ